VNQLFTTSQPYKPGTTAVFLNGQLKTQTLDDGWVETDPGLGQVTLKEPPRSFGNPDVVQIFYIDTSPVLPETVVDTPLVGVIEEVATLEGELLPTELLEGLTSESEGLEGGVVAVDQLGGVVHDVEQLQGLIVEVC